MKRLRDVLAGVVVTLGAAAEMCDGGEDAVRAALTRVQRARRDLQDVEARLRTILTVGRREESE